MKKLFSITAFVFTSICVFSQIGGNSVYRFLDVPVSARVASLGGSAIAISDDDLNLTFDNPSLLHSGLSRHLSFSYINYVSDINSGQVNYAHHFNKLGTFSAGVKFFNYGKFVETDNGGNIQGEFNPGDYAFIIGYGKMLDSSFSIGANLTNIYSDFYQYNSYGAALDISATYQNRKKEFVAALVARNMGYQFVSYNRTENEPLPFDLQLGISKKFEHVPFRFSVVAHHLQKFNFTYVDSTQIPQSLDPSQEEEFKGPPFTEKLMRHFIFGGEFLLTKNFHIRMGYNYQRRKELVFANRKGAVGMSFGLGFKAGRFHFSYGLANYHLAGWSNHFTLSSNLGEFFKRAN